MYADIAAANRVANGSAPLRGAPAGFVDISRCPLCASSRITNWLDSSDPHYGNPGVFAIFECGACGVKFLNPMPTLAYLERAYPAEYYAHQAVPGTGSVATKILRRLIFYAPKHTGDPKFRNPGRMVDIGCGAGEFLLKMRIRGWEVQGVEMSRAAAEAGRRLYGLDIVGGTLGEAQLPSATFDYVRLNHSFEHMTDPIQALTEIRRIIKPRGRLFIGVPNGDSLAAQVAGRYWWNLGPPVHPFTYNPATLSRLLREAGFAIERLSFNSSFAGLVGSLQIYLNRGTKRPSHVGWAMGCFPLRLAGHWTAKILDLFRMGDCIEITAIPAPRGNADDVARQ